MIDNREEKQRSCKCPPPGTEKVNWNVAIDSLNGRIGIGIIVLDHEECIIVARSITNFVIVEPIITEALAALREMELTRDLWLQRILLEGDMIQIMNVVKANVRN